MMTAQTANSRVSVQNGGLEFNFLTSGDLYEAKALDGPVMINQWLSNPLDGALQNIYARLYLENGISYYPLLGAKSAARFRKAGNQLVWQGEITPADKGVGFKGRIGYEVTFTLTGWGVWFWEVKLDGSNAVLLDNSGRMLPEGNAILADVVYGQDVGIAHPGAVRSNEAYVSQYIDHTVFKDEDQGYGYIVCSRQNQPQGDKFPYLQQGALTGAAGYSTDGFQFFGLSYKETDQPAALLREHLDNEIYQYEFAYTALQSPKVQLKGSEQFVFYGLFQSDHPLAVTGVEFTDRVAKAWLEAKEEQDKAQGLSAEAGRGAADGGKDAEAKIQLSPRIGTPLQTLEMLPEELDMLYPNRKQEEIQDGKLLAFFTDTYEHVVLKDKELLVERPHGHILMSGDNAKLNPAVMTTTSYMYGIFNSQVVVGNTNLNKMMTNARNALNIPKTSGQRIYVEMGGVYRLLALPSLFEMGFNYARWYYKTPSDTLVITNYTVVDSPEVVLHVSSVSGAAYRFLMTNQLTMNVNEYEIPYHLEKDAETGGFLIRADKLSLSSEVYPDLVYRMIVKGADVSLGDETRLLEGEVSGSASLAVLELEASSSWTLTFQGLLNGGSLPVRQRSAKEEITRYRNFFREVMKGFKLTDSQGEEGGLFKVNALAWWYTHNMLVHYSVPHGLEQYGGAAWGTRDVCQGPVEYFMATQSYAQVREILLTVFAHQYEEDGSWPQWFMFDKYTTVQQEESHGDIIVWPLKVLGDYLAATHDFSILEARVPYTRKEGFVFTESAYTIREHVKLELAYIKGHFLHDSFMSSYGDGDWDDTLQPANAQLKLYMVSSWTVALTYQAVNRLASVLKQQSGPEVKAPRKEDAAADAAWAEELNVLAEGIKRDFRRYILGNDVIPGFLYFEDPEHPKLMLHPSDQETGIQYRLLPMTRSMISELLSPAEMEAHFELIQERLFCPDGVRLMNRPAQYVGGVSVHFKRAEQAANFGREIGLQYVHAHIRYVEAMAKIGRPERTWSGLAAINPVGLREVVPNAELRQSNAYFSSSDGKFKTRYEAQERFGELRSGQAPVKGGWRIYSSGPGIYMNQLIASVLGIRIDSGDLIVDPVLPAELDGTRFEFVYNGEPVTFVYRYTDGVVRGVTINGQPAAAAATANPYRAGGLKVARADFEKLRRPDGSQTIEIQM